MGKGRKEFNGFVDDIPDDKLTGISEVSGTIYKTNDFRLDMQGMTSGELQMYNLQIQINNETKISTLKRFAPQTVSTVLAPVGPEISAQELRDAFKENCRI